MILRRYMTRQVAINTALVLGFLLVLLLGGRTIRYFGIAAEGGLDVGLLFAIIGYNLPYFLELLLPLAFFIALMLVFGRLYVDLEMAVLNSSGISRGSLARLITPLILVLFVVEAGVSLVAKPWGVRESDNIWASQAIDQAFDLIKPKQFISSGDYHLYVGAVNAERTELQDVILIQEGVDDQTDIAALVDNQPVSNDSDLSASPASDKTPSNTQSRQDQNEGKDTIILAKRAVQVIGVGDENNNAPTNTSTNDTTNPITDAEGDRTQLELYQGRRFVVGAHSKAYNQISFERYRISIDTPRKMSAKEQDIETQTLGMLWPMATHTAANDSKKQLAQAELGYRLALPWLIVIAPMLAVPLAQVRPRQGRWLRLLPAVMIFAATALVIISLKTAIGKGNAPVWSYAVAIIGFMALALYFNWASRIHHRVRFNLTSKRQAQKPNDKGNLS